VLNRIQQWLALPNFPDEEDRRVGGILRTLLLMLLAASIIIILVSAIYGDQHVVWALILGAASLVGGLIVVRQGHLRLAVFIVITTFLVVITYLLTLGQGIHDIGVLAIPTLIIVGSLLLGKRAFLAFMSLCTAAVAIIVYDEVNLINASGLSRAWSDFIIVEITLIATAVAARLLADNLLQSLARARLSEQALSESYRQLQRHASSLEASEARWRSLVENAPDIVLTVLRDGTIKFSNDATLPEAGLIVGQSAFSFIAPQHQTLIRDAIERVFVMGEATSVEVQTLAPDNVQRWYALRLGPIKEEGQVTSLTLIATDVSERRQAEAARQAIASQQAHMLAETTEALQREQRLNEVAYTISSDLDLQQIMPNVVRLAAELVGAQAGSLALLSPDGETVSFPYTYQIPFELQQSPFRRGEGLVWRVIESRTSLSLDDYPAQPEAVQGWIDAGIRAFLSVPLMVGDDCLGALGLFGLEPTKRFTARDQAVAEAVGRQAAIAVQHARLFNTEQHRVDLLTALHETGLGLSNQLDLPILLRTIVERAAHLAQASMGSIYLYEPDGETLRLVLGHNLLPDYAVPHLRPGEGVAGRVANTGQPLVVDDYLQWPGRVATVPLTAFRSVMGVPIQWQGRALGVLNLLDEQAAHFGQAEVETVRLFAAQAAVAIQNAELFDSTRRQLAELTILHFVVLAAAHIDREDDLIKQATTIIGENLFPDYCGVLLVDPVLGVLRIHDSERGAGEIPGGPIALGQGVSGTVALHGQSWRLSDVRQEPTYIPAKPGMLSELCVPLKVGDKVIGVVNVESAKLDAFSGADERLLTTLAGQLATAIERLRAEAAVRQLNAELERRVIERTTELNVANQELEAFSYSVSHDLRTPLRSISGFSQIVLDDYYEQLDDVGRQYLRTVLAECQHMASLIDDLLNLSRVTRAQLRRGQVNLSQLAGLIVARLRQSQPERQVECLIAPDMATLGDQNLLGIVLENLLTNAWKFTGKQTQARIELGLEPQPSGPPAFFVRDNGAGFDMAYADKLFGAFERLHSQREFAGTGVGLAIVQRIIKRHGGRVWAQGVVNQGATFYFTLAGDEVPVEA